MRFFCFHLMPWAHLPEDFAQRVGFGLLVANFSVGNVPTELTQKSVRLFAQEVMPKLKHINSDAPVTAGAVA